MPYSATASVKVLKKVTRPQKQQLKIVYLPFRIDREPHTFIYFAFNNFNTSLLGKLFFLLLIITLVVIKIHIHIIMVAGN